jgi:lipopolysaccharide transport system ATP-binding protein
MSKNLAIKADKVSKQYRLGAKRARHDTLRDLLAEGFKSLLHRGKHSPKSSFWALKDINFEISHGENVGIIGLNGAGKSTLLKILSRITGPTTGRVRIAGRVGALLEVGTGFHGELTGRENTFLYGAILGMSKHEISRKFDAIVEFAEIADFIDTPVKRYSSGMYVRLAFSVAAHLQPNILLLDEVLSVGDLPFQRKCMEFAKGLQKSNATILFVSHNMFSIKTMCNRVIYLKHGELKFDGKTDEGITLYEQDCRLNTLPWTTDRSDEWPILLTDIVLSDEKNHAKTVFDFGERMKLRLSYESRHPLEAPNFIIAFIRSDGVACCNYSTEADGIFINQVNGKGFIELITPPLKLVSELYTIHIIIRKKGFQDLLCAQIGSTFHIRHSLYDTHFGVFHEPAQWLLESSGPQAI